jgi:hypothetical protein
MTKSERIECNKLDATLRALNGKPIAEVSPTIGYAARGFSALARASKKPNEIRLIAMGWPAVVAHADYIV